MMTQSSSPSPLTLDNYLALPAVAADHRLAYGQEVEQFGDLYLPPRPGPHPVVLLLHGGCWQAKYDLHPLGSLCHALREEGLAVWSLEYRRLGAGGGWPTTFQDVATGGDFLKSIAQRFSLDLTRVVAVGHSAGGHLALWLAGRHRLQADSVLFVDQPLQLAGVVVLAGIPDLAVAAQESVCGDAPVSLLGGTVDEVPDRYRQASPVELLPLGVPQRHLVGAEDILVPAAYVEAYVAVASRHDDVQLGILAHMGHFELVDPSTPAWPALRRAVLSLLPG
jgi:pimeloyl-ACP methyl ester carboxylesterase